MNAVCVCCGEDLGFVASDGVAVQCSDCTMRRCLGLEAQTSAQLSAVDADEVAAARQVHGWSQEDLALYLKLPKSTVGRYERGLIQCPQEVADWLASQ